MKQQSEEELIDQYLPLVNRIVRRIKRSLPRHVEEDELLSFGMMGLMDACLRYNQQKNVKFETYATKRIRGEIYDGLRRSDPLSRTLRKKEKQVSKAYDYLEQNLFRQPSIREVSRFLNISEEACNEIISLSSFEKQDSLYEPVESGEDHLLKIDLLSDQSFIELSQIIEKKELKHKLSSLIDTLSERERIILSLIYYENLSMSEIGRILRLHKSRISQIHSQVLKKLKKALEKEGIW